MRKGELIQAVEVEKDRGQPNLTLVEAVKNDMSSKKMTEKARKEFMWFVEDP